ncbi:MAG: MarR family transcriptional regulator [Candidatus Thermoplasmatota archaeon]|nr:MarR family transcriptional regulator [Candidatus Thermoplasmatota archaeon]
MEQSCLPRMPPSSRTVLDALSRAKISTLNAIINETGLPSRTVQLALKNLIALKLVNVRICLNDTRRKFYCYSRSSE